jgi:hypothetical protein
MQGCHHGKTYIPYYGVFLYHNTILPYNGEHGEHLRQVTGGTEATAAVKDGRAQSRAAAAAVTGDRAGVKSAGRPVVRASVYARARAWRVSWSVSAAAAAGGFIYCLFVCACVSGRVG